MKKLFIIATVFGALALTSCKKDWSCDCTGQALGMPISVSETSGFSDMTKKDAKEKCKKEADDANKEMQGFGTVSCEISKK